MNDNEPLQQIPHPQATKEVTLRIPADSYEAMQKEAARRDMSLEALLKFYIGTGFRQDVPFVRVPSRPAPIATPDESAP